MSVTNLPAITSDAGLSQYLAEIKKFPVLTEDQEYMAAKAWREHQDRDAVQLLITSHLRLVAKIAMGYRGYGLPVADLIAEGNIGMMQAVKKYDPDRGFRFATYAMWWIKASMQEYILKSWSLVKIGTTGAQKKLFFNLRKLKNKLQEMDGDGYGSLSPEHTREIANTLAVPEYEVTSMEQRLSSDLSLNTPRGMGGSAADSEDAGEWQDWLPDNSDNQEVQIATLQELKKRQDLLKDALDVLTPRERHILAERRLREPPSTLEDLSQHYNISRERVRQIENAAFDKLRTEIARMVGEDVSTRKLLPGR